MEWTLSTLRTSPLFEGMKREELELAAQSLRARRADYAKNEALFQEEDPCTSLGIVASGSVRIQRIYPSGRSVVLETINAGGCFGEALLFADRAVYPATLLAAEETSVLYVPKDAVMGLMSASPAFMQNMLRSLSSRILLLNRRIKGLSVGSVRQRVANYLLEEREHQRSDRVALGWGRQELADALGIPRPSLSRELAALKDEGLIDFDRRTVAILRAGELEAALND